MSQLKKAQAKLQFFGLGQKKLDPFLSKPCPRCELWLTARLDSFTSLKKLENLIESIELMTIYWENGVLKTRNSN